MKKIALLFVVMMAATFSAVADNWLIELSSPGGYTYENGTVAVTYAFERNVTKVGGYLQPTNCEPNINVKIKNTTDDFIYLDLSKTYITRNGEAALYQNTVSMSKDKGDNDDNSKISQTVMPVPPHASKTLTFSVLEPEKPCYDNKYLWDKMYKAHYYKDENAYQKDVFEYDIDNSPIKVDISFAYSTTEKGEKQVRVNKEFYANFMAALTNTKDRDLDEVMPNRADRNWFTTQNSGYFPKKKQVKEKKSKKDDKKDKKDKKEDKKNKKDKEKNAEAADMIRNALGGRRG